LGNPDSGGGSDGAPDRFRVLLSTHNGVRFLSEQVQSVLGQRDVDVELCIRDDGSTDATLPFLRDLAAADSRITLIEGERMGPARSYLTMLSESDEDIDYVALCDQDDIWIDGKLTRAAAWLSHLEGPAMYCSAVQVVDADLQPVGVHRTGRRGPSFENALVQNIATGCTIVVNRPALRLFRRVPLGAAMHDWWIYATVAGVGVVRYDPSTWVLYRQHDANSIGLAASQTTQWTRRVRQHVDSGKERVGTRQARELLEFVGPEMTPEALSTLTRFVQAHQSVAQRLHYALTGPISRQRRIDSVVYRALFALGRI
jgi:glycosyltransferase involved in cell wall biosynthesis